MAHVLSAGGAHRPLSSGASDERRLPGDRTYRLPFDQRGELRASGEDEVKVAAERVLQEFAPRKRFLGRSALSLREGQAKSGRRPGQPCRHIRPVVAGTSSPVSSTPFASRPTRALTVRLAPRKSDPSSLTASQGASRAFGRCYWVSARLRSGSTSLNERRARFGRSDSARTAAPRRPSPCRACPSERRGSLAVATGVLHELHGSGLHERRAPLAAATRCDRCDNGYGNDDHLSQRTSHLWPLRPLLDWPARKIATKSQMSLARL